MSINEELIEKQLETTETRLNDHAERIRSLESNQAVTDTKIEELCKQIDKSTKSMNALTGTLITTLIGFFIWAIQTGLFN